MEARARASQVVLGHRRALELELLDAGRRLAKQEETGQQMRRHADECRRGATVLAKTVKFARRLKKCNCHDKLSKRYVFTVMRGPGKLTA